MSVIGVVLFLCSVFCFCLLFLFLTFFHLSQAIEAVQVSWAFCENCLSPQVFCGRVFSQHGSANTSMGTPVLFTGAPGVVTAFFGYFF